MKYTVSVIIEENIDEVVHDFLDPKQAKYWMKGLVSRVLISGKQGEVDSISKLEIQLDNRDIILTETLVSKNLPEEITYQYIDEPERVYNTVRFSFEKLEENLTKCISENEFEFKGLSMKFVGFFFPNAFKRQSLKYLTDLKKHVESRKKGFSQI